jgi:hypothetical protein
MDAMFRRLCEKYAQLEIDYTARGIPVFHAKDPGLRECVKARVKELAATHAAAAQAQPYETIAWTLIRTYPVISDTELRAKIRDKLPNDPDGRRHVFSLVRSRSYKATAFSSAQLKAMTKMMEATKNSNIQKYRERLETLPGIQAASEMNNRKRALFKKLNARHATLRATWAARKQRK